MTKSASPVSTIPTWMKSIVALLLILAIVVLATYFLRFGLTGGLGDQEKFGQFGDYVGGLLNPLLSFSSVLILLWSVRTQSQQLLASHKALEQAQLLHHQEIALQRRESIRAQLRADAESYVACCEDLLAKRVFKVFVAGTHADISLNDTFKNPDYFGDAEVNRLLTGIHDRMNKGDAISLHLSTLKTQTAFAVHSTCELIQYLDLPALISSWKMKVETLISDVRGANVLTDTELQDFKMALLGALVIKDQTQHA